MRVHLVVDRGDGLSASTEFDVPPVLWTVGPVAVRDVLRKTITDWFATLTAEDAA